MGGLHGLVNDGQQLAGQGIQVDLLPQPDAEVIDRGRRVVAAPVETPIHRLLDTVAGSSQPSGLPG
jgi:hypothetical protein